MVKSALLQTEQCLRCHNPIADNSSMTEKEIVMQAVRELPDDCSIDDIADRIEFLAAERKGALIS